MARRLKTLPIFIAPEAKRPMRPEEEVLGRNLASAYIATQHGVGIDYARQKHLTNRSASSGSLWRAWSWSISHSILDCPHALRRRSSDASPADPSTEYSGK